MRVIASIQLAVLQQRQRTTGGHAVKKRKRLEPRKPRAIRPKARATVRKRALEAAKSPEAKRRCVTSASAVLDELVHPSQRVDKDLGALRERFRQAPSAAPPWHDWRPLEPHVSMGQGRTSNGVLYEPWQCRECGSIASSSTALQKLAQRGCAGLEAPPCTFGKHVMQQSELGGELWECVGCGLVSKDAQVGVARLRKCPVPRTGHVGDWNDEDRRHWRMHLGLLGVFRDWCVQQPQDPVATVVESQGRLADGPDPLQPGAGEEVPPPPPPFVENAPGGNPRMGPLRYFRLHRPLWKGEMPCCVWCGLQPRNKERAQAWLREACMGRVAAGQLHFATRHALRVALEVDCPAELATRLAELRDAG